MRIASPRIAMIVLATAALAGCNSGMGPGEPRVPRVAPVAQAQIEVLTMEAGTPDPAYDATCQTGAVVLLKATGSHDPAGLGLTYEWHDTVLGEATADFYPRANPYRTRDLEMPANLFTIGFHDVTLTVTAADGRKARTTLRIKVTGCDC